LAVQRWWLGTDMESSIALSLTRPGKHGTPPAPPSFVGVLDSVSPAPAFAVSVRRLSSTYFGALLRVRRSSDNAELDIGCDASGNMDVSALLTFTGASSGFAVVWYDQSGNGLDAVQATAGLQPKIVNAGSVVYVMSRPALETIYKNMTAPVSLAQPFIRNFVWTNANSPYNTAQLLGSTNYTDADFAYSPSSWALSGFNSDVSISAYESAIFWNTWDGPTSSVRKNGITGIQGNVGGSGQTNLLFGGDPDNVYFSPGYFSEIIVWGTNFVNGKTDVENSQGTYYSLDTPVFSGMLDKMTCPANFAASLRRLTGLYNGPLIRIRRDSDNAEADIGYDSSGDLDTAALLTFVGSGDGFVVVWYDQSTYASNAVQVTAGSQPKIVSSGAVITAGTKPTVVFESPPTTWLDMLSNRFYGEVSLVGQRQIGYESFIESIVGPGNYRGFTLDSFGTSFEICGLYKVNGTLISNPTEPKNVLNVYRGYSPNDLTSKPCTIGYATPGFASLNGSISELIVFPGSTSDADRTVTSYEIHENRQRW
jgi:Alpha-L-arabinofuranosidase B, catalytic